MLTAPRGMSMSGSMAPDPPVRAARRGLRLRFALVVATSLIWVQSSSRGQAGPPRPGSDQTILCHCGEVAGKLPNGKYACTNGHVSEKPKKKKSQGKGKK